MELVELFGGRDDYDGAQVTFRLHETREHIVVSLFKSDTTESSAKGPGMPLVDRLIRLLAQSMATDDDDELEALQDEAFEPIHQAAKSIIPEPRIITNEPNTDDEPDQESSLHTILYPKTSHYRLESTTPLAGPVLVPIPAHEAYTISFDNGQALLDYQTQIQIDASLPRYTTQQVRVIKEMVCAGSTACLVTVDGQSQQFFCKARQDGLGDSMIEREIECLQEILKASPYFVGKELACQVPALKGFVEHPDNGVIVGLLREWVPSECDLGGFEDTPVHEMYPREMRERWAVQIRRTVESLHAIGVVWGNTKPGNIIIDLNGDAWIIDFGGGWTDGWVDEKLQGTVEGDKQGVARILKFLDVDI